MLTRRTHFLPSAGHVWAWSGGLLAVVLGCVAPQPIGNLDQADQFFEEGNYARALTDYRIALGGPLHPTEQERARYRMGAAYYYMRAYADAAEALEGYLVDYPRGVYRPEARRFLQAIREGWESRQQERAEEYQNLMTQIEELEKKIAGNGRDARVHYELADLYWRAGLWEKSTHHYAVALRENPAYETDPLVVGRVRMNNAGSILPRYPVVTSDIFGNEGPLRIENAKSQVVSELDYRGESRIFLVSGDVVNTSVRPYGPVSVQVSILDFEDRVINSRVVGVGRLEGGQRGRFNVQLLVYGSPINITRYECKLIYER